MSTPAKKPRVAFQGERGAFSEEAALKLLGDEIELGPQPTFAALFDSLGTGVAVLMAAATVASASRNQRARRCSIAWELVWLIPWSRRSKTASPESSTRPSVAFV